MASGSLIAGENYTLECSAGGSMGTFQWLGPSDGGTPIASSGSITITSTSTTSQLQFMPLQQSHNGSYSCSTSSDGQTLSSEPIAISVNGINLMHNSSSLFTFPLQLPLCQSRSLMVDLLQLQEKIISSPVVYLELKTSTLQSLTSGLRTVVVKCKLGTQTLSPSLHYDCLMVQVMPVKSPLLQATSLEIL